MSQNLQTWVFTLKGPLKAQNNAWKYTAFQREKNNSSRIRLASDFLIVTLKARIQWSNGSLILKENYLGIRTVVQTFKFLFK